MPSAGYCCSAAALALLPLLHPALKVNVAALYVCRDTEDDKNQMIADLRAGRYEALVLDSPVLEYTVGTNDKCDLFTVGEPFGECRTTALAQCSLHASAGCIPAAHSALSMSLQAL